MALLLQLLDLPVAPEGLARLSPEARQARTFALLRHLVLDAAQRQPLVLVVENLHWSDPTSEAWLASLVERLAGAAVLLLGTYRPGYQPAWGAHAAVTQVAVTAVARPGQPDRRPGGAGRRDPPRGTAAGDGGAGGGQSVLFGGVGVACRGTGRAGHAGGGARDGARGAGGPHGPAAPGGEAPAADRRGDWHGGALAPAAGHGRAARGGADTGAWRISRRPSSSTRRGWCPRSHTPSSTP